MDITNIFGTLCTYMYYVISHLLWPSKVVWDRIEPRLRYIVLVVPQSFTSQPNPKYLIPKSILSHVNLWTCLVKTNQLLYSFICLSFPLIHKVIYIHIYIYINILISSLIWTAHRLCVHTVKKMYLNRWIFHFFPFWSEISNNSLFELMMQINNGMKHVISYFARYWVNVFFFATKLDIGKVFLSCKLYFLSWMMLENK